MATGGTNKQSTSNKMIVAAIDFGTTYSGFAFSFKNDFNKDPLKIGQPEVYSTSNMLQSFKTPTIVLLDKEKRFVAFGFEAEDKYLQLLEDEEDEDYYYFRRFKMNLHITVQMKKSLLLKDVKGKEVEALTVFSSSILFLKNKLEKLIEIRGTLVGKDDIQWVLTVPAIWTDGAKQFMRVAAEMAGITNENLAFALEPEAASILCMHLELSIEDPRTKQVTKVKGFPVGTRYMVVDIGGGTVDITVHEVEKDEYLKELAPPTGGPWGGTTIDENLIDLLKNIVGTDVYTKFAEKNQESILDLYRNFETKKRSIKIGKEIRLTPLQVPYLLIEAFEKKNEGCNITDRISRTHGEKIYWKKGQFKVDFDILSSFFDTTVRMTIEKIADILRNPSGAGVNTILLVGGCAESPLIREKIKSHFPNKRFVIPEDAGLAVLKGAVIYGHRPTTIVSRIARYSYGICVYRPFDGSKHPQSKLKIVGGKRKCQDVFGVHVRKGQELRIGEAQAAKRYTCLESDQISMVFDFYTSPDKNPTFVTDPDCKLIGQLELMLTGSTHRSRGIFVSIIFGGTELVVQAVDEETKQKTKAEFKFLTE